MDERRAGEILDALARSAPDGLVLWRGEGLAGSDIDVVATPGHDHRVARALHDCGLAPAPQDPGQVLWRQLPGPSVVVDVLAGHAWPPMYPALPGVVERASRGACGLLVASVGDRLLFHAAEALAGWPMERTVGKLEAARGEPGAHESLCAVIREEPGLRGMASLATGSRRPSRSAVLGAAARSRNARAALRGRLIARLGFEIRHPLPAVPAGRRATPPGMLVALSGMDGAGKSTAALGLVEALGQAGRPAVVHWTRVAVELRALARLARGVRRLLGRDHSLSYQAPPAAEGAPGEGVRTPARHGFEWLVDTGWVTAVALANVRSARRAVRLRRRGFSVVCDRWMADALVDIHVRYGRRPAAEWVLHHGYPRADHAVLLEIDDVTAGRRKPGDQTPAVLRMMSESYAELAGRLELARVDAREPSDAVLAQLRAVVLEPGLGTRSRHFARPRRRDRRGSAP